MMTLVSFDPAKQVLHLFALSLNDLEEKTIPVIEESFYVINGVVSARIVQQIQKVSLAESLRGLAGVNNTGLFHFGEQKASKSMKIQMEVSKVLRIKNLSFS